MKLVLAGVLIPIVALACARQPDPSPLSPTPALALGNAAYFGAGLVEAGSADAVFQLNTAAHVRLLAVDGDAAVAPLEHAAGGRRAAGTHHASVAGTAVSYTRTQGWQRGMVGAVPAAALDVPNGGWCQTAVAFARLYERSRVHWALADDGPGLHAPTHPASFDPWAGVAKACSGTPSLGYGRPAAGGLGLGPDGYWLLIVTDAPLSLARLSTVIEREDLRALDAEELVRVLPGELVAAEAPAVRWAAYVLAR